MRIIDKIERKLVEDPIPQDFPGRSTEVFLSPSAYQRLLEEKQALGLEQFDPVSRSIHGNPIIVKEELLHDSVIVKFGA